MGKTVSSSRKQNYHSITFKYKDSNGKEQTVNTWTNWNLIPTARPVVKQPTPNYTYVDIPGADGSLDISNYLIGRPTYSDRSGTFDFYVMNNDGNNWPSRKAAIVSVLDGSKVMKMYLDDDQNYYYEGRFYMRDWTPDPSYSRVTIEYRVKPYRYLSNGKVAGL